MKHYFTLFVWSLFLNLIFQVQAQRPKAHPTVHLTYFQAQHGYELYEYVSPLHGKSQPAQIIPGFQTIPFTQEMSIFWKNHNKYQHKIDIQSRDLKSAYELKLKLTCRGRNVTQWKINSVEDYSLIENSDQAELPEINYSVTPLPRYHENPLAENADMDNTLRYNWTELTIESFGPNFKSGSIDCVMDGEDNLKSQLYIFQRFSDKRISPFKSKHGHVLTFNVDRIIPCTVHDPGVKPTLTLEPLSRASYPEDVSDTFTYHWKHGFTSTLRSVIKNWYKFGCSYGSSDLVTYQFLDISLQPSTKRPYSNTNNNKETLDNKNDFVIPEVQRISTDGNDTLKFVCRANESKGENIELKSIQLFACSSTDYCFPKSRANSTFKKCAESQDCFFVLPSTKDFVTFSIDTQGKVVCSAEVDQKKVKSEGFYYTTLNKNVELITQDELSMNQFLDLEVSVTSQRTVQVHCQALSFFTFPSIKFSIAFWNGTVASVESIEAVQTHKGIYSKTMELTSDLALKVSNVTCYVPPFDSLTWLHVVKSIGFKWNGHIASTFIIYNDRHVALFSDKSFESKFVENILVVSSAWRYAKETYGPLSSDPILSVVLTTGKGDGCRTSKMNSYLDETHNNKAVIDCTKLSGNWSLRTDMVDLVKPIANLTLRMAKETGNYPASRISKWQMADIVVYDIYNGIGKTEEANEWLEFKLNDTQDYPKENTFWFRDWYFPIYVKYGKAFVLNQFLTLLHKHFQKNGKGNDYAEQLKLEEFVHFWSGAAGVNLKSLANATFGWTINNERFYRIAQQTYPEITYAGIPSPQRDDYLLIFGLLFLGLHILLGTIVVTIHRCKIKRLREKLRELTNEEIQLFFEGNLNADKNAAGYAFIESQPFNKDFEIPEDQLSIFHDQVLGSGEFGLVLRGHLKNAPGSQNPETILVAVKTVKPNVDVTVFMVLLTELKVLCHVGSHENIAGLLGAVTTKIKNREVYIALEFCSKGDLLGYLKKHRTGFKDLLAPKKDRDVSIHEIQSTACPNRTETSFSAPESSSSSSSQSETFSTMDLANWSQQIASGMAFIGEKNVIHGDLAARNVLLTVENIAKISDFGLSRQLHNSSVYMKTSKTPLPWKWMAIESLRDMQFSIQSDVWAFGVTLFEIFTLGTLPYAGRTFTSKFLDELVEGLRLNSPKYGNEEIFNLMLNCMKLDPNDRIKFPEISYKFLEIKQKIISDSNTDATNNYLVV